MLKYSKPVCEYLRVIRKIYELSMADDLDPEYYSEQFREFKRTFLVLHKLIKLPWTLKVLKICLWTLDMKGIICRFILLVSITRNTSNCVVPPSNTAVESILKQCIVDWRGWRLNITSISPTELLVPMFTRRGLWSQYACGISEILPAECNSFPPFYHILPHPSLSHHVSENPPKPQPAQRQDWGSV